MPKHIGNQTHTKVAAMLCPRCGSLQTKTLLESADDVQSGLETKLRRFIVCTECGKTWMEYYTTVYKGFASEGQRWDEFGAPLTAGDSWFPND